MKIVILGAGESGIGAAILAQQKDFEVFVSDLGNISEKYEKELIEKGIPYEEGRHSRDRIFEADKIVKSPGIPDTVPLIKDLVKAGIPVVSEIEFAAEFTDATLIGITGSNGKTTTTNLLYHLLKHAGLNVGVAGNVGFSFARKVAEEQYDVYILELSSFQLDGIVAFRPHIALLLNITPDHLDRYDYKMENYIASKFRIIENQKASDVFFFNAKDESIAAFLKDKQLISRTVSLSDELISNNAVGLGEQLFDMSRSELLGRHNFLNALFATQAALELGVSSKTIQKALETFKNVAHRLERVAEIGGVLFINDSKATNVDAVFYALQAMTRPTIWMVGGEDKGNDYSVLMPFVREKVKSIVCLGLDNSKIKAAFGDGSRPIVESIEASDAVEKAFELAEEGDVVLLSPACASFDLFKNYEERGDLFKKAVGELKIENGAKRHPVPKCRD